MVFFVVLGAAWPSSDRLELRVRRAVSRKRCDHSLAVQPCSCSPRSLLAVKLREVKGH